jgi:hypothetical protein
MASPDFPAEVSKADEHSFILSKAACDTIHANAAFPDWVDESRDCDIDPSELDELSVAVGWRARGETQWRRALYQSTGVISLRVRELDMLIGFGRMSKDGGKVMLYDGMIHPTYQGLGLFKTMLVKAEKHLEENEGIQAAFLVAENGTETMYRHLGLRAMYNPDSNT